MNGRSVRAGLLAAAGLSAFYATVIALASGPGHLADQARADWPYLSLIVAGFATQVALLVELRHRRRARRLEQAAAGAGVGSSAVGMVACCAHHLADLAPIVGISGAATFLTDWRVEFMLAGIAVNAIAIAVAARRLWADGHMQHSGGAAWHAA